jgi:hypothetical protein
VDHLPDPLLLRKSGSARDRTRTTGSVARDTDNWTTEEVILADMYINFGRNSGLRVQGRIECYSEALVIAWRQMSDESYITPQLPSNVCTASCSDRCSQPDKNCCNPHIVYCISAEEACTLLISSVRGNHRASINLQRQDNTFTFPT